MALRASSQLLIAVRLLNSNEHFTARLNMFLDSGKICLYCRGPQILLVELGDLFPASWLSKMTLNEVALKLRSSANSDEKIQAFKAITEKPELRRIFSEVVQKHLSQFFAAELKKCEMKPDQFTMAPFVLTLTELLYNCAQPLLKNLNLEDLIPGREILFQLAPDYLEKTTRVKISLQEGYLLSRLEQAHTLDQILSTVPGNEEDTRESLALLWAFGILDSPHLNQIVPKLQPTAKGSPAPNAGPAPEKVADQYQAQAEMIEQTYLALARKDYYTLLAVSPRAEISDIKSAYYKLARKFHPDRFYGLEDHVLKEKVDVIFSAINVAYETLKSSKTRQQYDNASIEDRRITTATIASEVSEVKRGAVTKVAEDYFRSAQRAMAARNYFEAVQFLRSATQIAPENARYWRQLGISLSKNDQWRKEAEDSFNRAVELEPQDPENHLYLAFLYKNSGLKLRARKCFMAVLDLDPKNEMAMVQLKALDEDDREQLQKKGIRGMFKKK